MQIVFEDKHTRDNFTCNLHDWVGADDKTDGWRELPVQWPWFEPLQSELYLLYLE